MLRESLQLLLLDRLSPPHFSRETTKPREGVALSKVTQQSSSVRRCWAGATPGWVPRGSLHCALSKQETAALSNLSSRDGERVWLRDWQALKAEPGLSLENNLLERTWAEASVLGERRG